MSTIGYSCGCVQHVGPGHSGRMERTCTQHSLRYPGQSLSLAPPSLSAEQDFNGVDDYVTVHDSSVKRLVDSEGLSTDLVEHVAKALVNADIEGFGNSWPWPEHNTEAAAQAREEAREVARVAIRAIRMFEEQICDEEQK